MKVNKKGDLFYTLLHIPIDAVALWLAFLSAYTLRNLQGNSIEIYRFPFSDYSALMSIVVPLWIVMYAIQGMYTRVHLFGTLQNLSQIALASLAGWATFIVYLVFSKTEATLVFPRLMLIYILFFSVIYVFGGRLLLRFLQFLIRSLGYGRVRFAVLGHGALADEMQKKFEQSDDRSIVFVGRIDLDGAQSVAQTLRAKHVDELIIADTSLTNGQAFEYLIAVQDAGILCHLVPNMFDVQVQNVRFSTIVGMPVLTFRQTPLEGWGRIVKRIFDIVIGVLALIIFSPIFIILGLTVVTTDPGPIFYGHTRVGRDGKAFKLFKFRSMKAKYCAGPNFSGKSELEIFQDLGRHDLIAEFKRDHKVKNDPRISPIGSLMRKTRLDELPQLWNVVRGDLSLVGPRPIVTAEIEKYGRWASYLTSIKPGMTGLWQVSGGNDISYDERVKLDSHYVQNWSLWGDMIIIVKTFLTILGGHNAY